MHKLLLDRDSIAGAALASQPTISRFENGVKRNEPYEMVHALALRVVERHQRRRHGRARRITIGLDPTDDPTHGAQRLSFSNWHYDRWCYLPPLAFVTSMTSVNGISARPCCARRTPRRRAGRSTCCAGSSRCCAQRFRWRGSACGAQ